MRPDDAINIFDLQQMARRRLPKVVFDYLDGGSEDEVTLARNREIFRSHTFNPKVATGFGKRDLSIDLFGKRNALPFMIGPTGLNGLHRPNADIALARAAAAAGTVFALSTASNSSIEEVAASGPGEKWFQLYPWGDRKVIGRLIERAKQSGYGALVVTVDSLVAAKRERDARNNFSHELRMSPKIMLDGLMHPDWLVNTWFRGGRMPRFENVAEFIASPSTAAQLADFTRSQRNPGLNWDDIAWMRQQWHGPFLVKGILCGDDALSALRAGADGVVVSNHGGRQLDGGPSTLEVLPEVVNAVGDRGVVLIDGGFRRGTDIVKALALGAKIVLLGRATLYGVACGGQAGAAKALAILKEEVDKTLALLGAGSVASLTPAMLRPSADGRRPVAPVAVGVPDSAIAARLSDTSRPLDAVLSA